MPEDDDRKLKQFSSKIYVDQRMASRILSYQEDAVESFKEFHDERYIKRTRLLHDRIQLVKLPTMDMIADHKEKPKSAKEAKKDTPEAARAYKIFQIARHRGMAVNDILQHELVTYDPLFNGHLMVSANKSALLKDLEHYLTPSDYVLLNGDYSVCFVVDFMSFVRSYVTKYSLYETFGDLAKAIFQKINSLHPYMTLHVAFDSYVENSLKDSEREWRVKGQLVFSEVTDNTKLPNQMEKFWNCQTNKELLQRYIQEKLMEFNPSEKPLILGSTLVSNNVISAVKFHHNNATPISALTNSLEEADLKVVQHVHYAVNQQNCNRVFVYSNDTDVVVLLLRYLPRFKEEGLLELWQHVGTGNNRRLIPVHTISEKLGDPLSSIIIKCHIGTGCDYLSKVGSKAAILKVDPVSLLDDFGESPSMSDNEKQKAELFLVKCFSGRAPNTSATSFDELRLTHYQKTNSILALPPTSNSIAHHIDRWWYLVRLTTTLLSAGVEGLTRRGWHLQDDQLVPVRSTLRIPENFTCLCGCMTNCSSGRCKCKRNRVACSEYCSCMDVCINRS